MPTGDIMTHHPITLRADPSRVVIRPFVPADDPPALIAKRSPRAQRIADRVLALDTMYINAIALLVLFGIYQGSILYFEAALLSAVPLALGGGAGAELRQPLGIALIGGLLLSQVLTLFTTPVIYLYFDRLSRRISGRSAAGLVVNP